MRTIDDYGVDMTSTKFELAPVPSANVTLDRSDVRSYSLSNFLLLIVVSSRIEKDDCMKRTLHET